MTKVTEVTRPPLDKTIRQVIEINASVYQLEEVAKALIRVGNITLGAEIGRLTRSIKMCATSIREHRNDVLDDSSFKAKAKANEEAILAALRSEVPKPEPIKVPAKTDKDWESGVVPFIPMT
jgi:HD-GYP domain-containing protein (c-di-GMP phosphodiesterase class II)